MSTFCPIYIHFPFDFQFIKCKSTNKKQTNNVPMRMLETKSVDVCNTTQNQLLYIEQT